MQVHSLFASAGFLFGLSGCDFDGPFNADPCSLQYDRDRFISLIDEQNELRSWGVSPKNFRSKVPLDPDTVECDVIRAELGFRYDPPVQEDSFAIALAKTFYGLPKNSSVERLELQLKNSIEGVGGSAKASYVFGPNLSHPPAHVPSDKSSIEEGAYTIVSEQSMTIHRRGEERPGLTIVVQAERKWSNMSALAISIRGRYMARVRAEAIKEMKVDIDILKPSCSLCTSQEYSFWFIEENGNL